MNTRKDGQNERSGKNNDKRILWDGPARWLILALAAVFMANLIASRLLAKEDSAVAEQKLQAVVKQSDGTRSQTLTLMPGGHVIIDLNVPIARAVVSAPEIAEVTVMSPRQVLLVARGVGSTQLIIWGEQDQQLVYAIEVEPDLSQLDAAFERIAPGMKINIQVLRGAVILTGQVPDVDTADRIMEVARTIVPDSRNRLTVVGEQQVLLRCTFAEVDKNAVRQLGINGWLAGDNFRDAFVVNQLDGINPANIGAVGGANVRQNMVFATDQAGIPLTTTPQLSLGFPRVQMQLFFQALRQNSLMRVLAEPNLTALNGQEASFVAGGEFAVPVAQGNGAVGIEYKDYGIILRFVPTIIGHQMIRLTVGAEVSELDTTAGTQLLGQTVPGLSKRQARTTLEMANGTTIAMAGLLNERMSGQVDRIPGLGDVPVLGQLFRSVEYKRRTTELVVLVTPELVSAMTPDQVKSVPGQNMREPNDWELYGLGLLEGEASGEESVPAEALETQTPVKYRKYSSPPEQLSLHGPWGPAEELETVQ